MPQPEEPVERKLITPSGKLALLRYGSNRRDCTPWLAVHGWQDNAASFAPLAEQFPDRTIYAVDLPGHGLSDWIRPAAAYTFLEWTVAMDDAVESLLGLIGAERVILLGHSLGGALALVVAGLRPRSVERVVTLDGFAPRTQEADEAHTRLVEYLANRRRRPTRKRRAYPSVEDAAERLASLPGAPSLEACLTLTARGTEPTPDGVRWRRDPRIMDGPPARLPRAQMWSYLRAVHAPVDILRPAHGWPFPSGWRQWLTDAIPHAKIHDIPGGHHAHLEASADVAERLRAIGMG